MKILMLNPPFLPKYSRFSRSPAVTKSGTIYYPIWHAYATGVLEENGYDVKLIDAPADSISHDECYKLVTSYMPDIAVIYTSTPSIYNDIEVAEQIKLHTNCYTVLAGPHASAEPDECLKYNSIDAVARHEYDFTLLELCKNYQSNKKISSISGLSLKIDGKIIHNSDRPFTENLDDIPFISSVYKKHLNYKNYFYSHCRYPIISIFTSRGCNAKCTWCLYPQQMFGQKARQRTAQNIVEEFLYIQKVFPDVKEVLIDDDTFIFSKEFAKEFSELMIKNNISVPWSVECRANLKLESMKLMKKAGCRLIVVGIESSNDKILKLMKKGMTVKRIKKFVEDAKAAKVKIHACYMAGNKGETMETLEETLNFAKWVNADTSQFFPIMVYPGTEDYKWAKENNYLDVKDYRQWVTEEGLHNCVLSTAELSSSELVNFCNYARKEIYLSKKYILNKIIQLIIEPKEIFKTVKAALIFSKFLFKKAPQS